MRRHIRPRLRHLIFYYALMKSAGSSRTSKSTGRHSTFLGALGPGQKVNPKSELNCETLDASLGLQLRWSLTDESSADLAMLLKLVANTGSSRYLTIGIRELS